MKLEGSIAAQKVALAGHVQEVPRLFLVEDEYAIAMTEAEASWVRLLLTELVTGTFPGLDIWTSGSMPPELAELAERGADS